VLETLQMTPGLCSATGKPPCRGLFPAGRRDEVHGKKQSLCVSARASIDQAAAPPVPAAKAPGVVVALHGANADRCDLRKRSVMRGSE